jgi:hypothetical protein
MDAGDREYAGAVAGMQEVYGPRYSRSKPVLRDGRVVDTWAAGDYIAFTTREGQRLSGYVIECLTDSGYGEYHVKAHLPGGGTEHFSVDGFKIAVF